MAKYRVLLEAEVHAARRQLPGNIRQRVKRLLDDLSANPRIPQSKTLDLSGLEVPLNIELRRIRIGRWRIIYAINDAEGWTWVLRIRQRPPYDYEDLGDIISLLE